jgi:putative PIN family toxin of toxin-antitoxin system
VRLVLDTNVWLDWLVFGDAGIAPIQAAVARGDAWVFISAACEAEIIRVLGYPLSGRALNTEAQAAALAQCRAIARALDNSITPHAIATLPRCKDPDDQVFLELARDCRADTLITKDRGLLALATRKVRPLPFRILTPRAFARG